MSSELPGSASVYNLLGRVYSLVEEMQKRVDEALPELVGGSTCSRKFIDLLLELEDLAVRKLGGKRLPGGVRHPALEGHTLVATVKVEEFLVVFMVTVENKCLLITPSMKVRVKAAVLHPQLGLVGLMEAGARVSGAERVHPVYIF